jgi:peroxiredoxin
VREAVFALSGVVVVLAAGLLGVFGLLQQMLRQQGRLLRRIESLENAGPAVAAAEPVEGLAVGTPLPGFRLPDTVGRLASLQDFRGKRLLLVHWNPQCGFCELIAPELASIQPALEKCQTELVLVSYGDVESNRRFAEQHGLTCRILHLDGAEPLEFFASLGTPVAYLVDEEGHIAERLAVGANEVPALARRAAVEPGTPPFKRSVEESRLEREGLKAGTPAPTFSLADLNGETVSLQDYRGRRVLLVFSDPTCGPCNALAPKLARFQREEAGDDLAVLLVSRGDLEANRAKAEEHDFEFPVLIQPGWRVSKAYGIFVTPIAFLIDEAGTIARDVAQGADAVLALASAATHGRLEIGAGI